MAFLSLSVWNSSAFVAFVISAILLSKSIECFKGIAKLPIIPTAPTIALLPISRALFFVVFRVLFFGLVGWLFVSIIGAFLYGNSCTGLFRFSFVFLVQNATCFASCSIAVISLRASFKLFRLV